MVMALMAAGGGELTTGDVTQADAEPAFVAIVRGVVTEPQASR